MDASSIKWEVVLPLAEKLGVKHAARIKWRQRDKVPAGYHLKLIEEAKREGKRLKPEDLGVAA